MSAPSVSLSQARLGVRLLALYFLFQGIWQLASNLLTSYIEFDPNYLGFYFHSQMASPLIGMSLGLGLFLGSGRLARRMLSGDDA